MDKKKFEEIYKEFNQRVFMTAYGITHNYDDSMDIMHETFIKYSKVTAEVSNVPAYISMIARNTALNYIKKERRKADMEITQLSIEQEIENRQKIEKLEQTLSVLSEQERKVFALKFYSGSEYGEIADLLGITQSTARVLLKRAVDKLKERINV